MGDKQLWSSVYGIRFADPAGTGGEPTDTIPEYAIPPSNSIWDVRETQGLDRIALHGFTIDELVDLGALAATKGDEENVLANNLEGPVNPAFAIDRWETAVPAHFKRKDLFAIGVDEDGNLRPGDYVASNKIVWQAILPSLLLASKFVENAHIFPWYLAVLHSDIYPVSNISPEAEKLDKPLRNFHFRPESDLISPSVEKLTRERIAHIVKNLRLGISDGKADPTGKFPQPLISYDGVSIPPWADDGRTYRIYIAYQVVERLLDENIGSSAKLALQFHLALTLLHEFAHVLVFAKDGARNVKLFLGNERISEPGSSFEVNTFGGRPVLVFDSVDKPEYSGSRAGFLLEDWLGTAKGHQLTLPLSGTESDWNDREWREAGSIPISFLEELGQEEFWRCFVGRWGAEALKVYPWTTGRLVRRDEDTLKTQVYLAPQQDREWLKSTLEYDVDPATLSAGEVIAHQFAIKRIARHIDIRKQSRTMQGAEEEKEGSELGKRGSPEKSQPKDEKPWEVRSKEIENQNVKIAKQIDSCIQEGERIRELLERKDIESPDYYLTREIMLRNNIRQCKSIRKQLSRALDDEGLSQMEQILAAYETMKGQLGRVSRQSSEDRSFEKKQLDIKNECTALLKKARQSRDGGELEKCSEYCLEVLAKDGASNFHIASAYLLHGLSITDPQLKLWYLMESVRIYKLAAHLEGANPRENTKTMTEHAKKRLKELVITFGPKILASIEVKMPITPTVISPPKIQRPETPTPTTPPPGPKGSPPKTPQNQIGIVPSYTFKPKKSQHSFSGFSNPADSDLLDSPSSRQGLGAPEDMSPIEIMRHRRTFKVINQARRNFFEGKHNLASKGFLELLNLEATTSWQKARCNVFLASMPGRNDRAERAKTALKMYREILKDDPIDERRLLAVIEARQMVKRVLTELGQYSEGIEFQDSKTDSNHSGSETDEFEDVESNKENREKKLPRRAAGNKRINTQPTSFLSKITSFLGLKRRREDDDDEENDRAKRERIVQPVLK